MPRKSRTPAQTEPADAARAAEQIRRLKKLYALSMTLSGDPLAIFKRAAQMIGDLFGVATVCLSEINADELRFLAIYENGQVIPDGGSCTLAATPCATVRESKDVRVYGHVSEQFPQAAFLRERNTHSYCGIPSLDSDGNVVAVTCLLDPKPREFSPEDLELLRIFGQRIGMEIERKHLLEEHRRIDNELRKLFRTIEQSPSAIMITNTAGVIEYVSPKFFEMTGYTAQEVLGRTPAILKSGMTPAEKYRELWDCLKTGREWHGEFLNRKKTGELYWARESISPIRDTGGNVTHFVAIEEDTTERKHIEERLRDWHKMEAVGQLAGGIAHDFNNLLTVTVGNLELLLGHIADDERLQKLGEAALRGALRAADSTRKLLAISRRQPLQPKAVEAKALVLNLSEILRATLGETIALTTVTPAEPCEAYADPSQIEASLLNLALNARDAMPNGGTLTIELANVRVDNGDSARHKGVRTGDYLMFAVRDTGHGMSSSVAARAFEPFFTTKATGKGSGLGLSTVDGFARQSGGFAELESEPGNGTCVRFFLPRLVMTDVAASDGNDDAGAEKECRPQ